MKQWLTPIVTTDNAATANVKRALTTGSFGAGTEAVTVSETKDSALEAMRDTKRGFAVRGVFAVLK